MGMICRQPNGKICRYSSITDCITDYNLTDEEYIQMAMDNAKEEAEYILKNCLKDYNRVMEIAKDNLGPNTMSEKEFFKIKKEMENVDDNSGII